MSKQFYNYLTKRLMSFLENKEIKAGERFFLQLDEKEQVKNLYEELKEIEGSEKFVYKHEKGTPYESFYLNLKDIKLVVSSTINVTEAYLVTIRNASRDQINEWNGTALLILSDSPKDSIKNGCLDLKNEGMPFSVKNISEGLNNDVENSDLVKVDKEIVKFYVKQKLENIYAASLWDYEEVLSIINKKKVEIDDYKKVGVFVDKNLENETTKSMQKRLKENYDLYSKVELYQEYEDKVQQLEKIFDDNGVDKLKKDNWRDIDFKVVKESFEKNKKNKPLGYIENREKDEYDTIYWERAKGDTAAGKRKRHIIIFDKGSAENLELNFYFDDTLYNEYLDEKSKKYAQTSGKKLKVKIPSMTEGTGFYKITYNHKKESKSKYEFFIAVIKIDKEYLKNIQAVYEVKPGNGKNGRIQINSDGTEVRFGKGKQEKVIEIENSNDTVDFLEESILKISNTSQAWENDSLKFNLCFGSITIPFEIKEQNIRKKPINSINLLKLKRELRRDFHWNDNKLTIETKEFYVDEKLKVILLMEKEIIEKSIIYGKEDINGINKIDVKYNEDLMKSYHNIIKYYQEKSTIPSLTYLNEELIILYKQYLEIFNRQIEEIQEKDIIANNELKNDLFKIGTIINEDRIMITPLNPINVAYILEYYKQLKNDEIDTHILERLSPENLLPYICNENSEIFRPIYQKNNVEWIIFNKKENVSIGETNAFIARVIKEKIEQFTNNFKYLFAENSVAPIKINIINIINDKEVVRGIFEYIKKQILVNSKNIIPVDINIYNRGGDSAFDKFFSLTNIDKIANEFNISFNAKNNQLDESDILRLVLENIKYFKKEGKNYEYAHISFFKPLDENKAIEANVNEIESGISIGGLLSTITSNNNELDYRVGFGTKNIIDEKNDLIRTAINMNEFATNCNNAALNPYTKGNSIVTRSVVLDEEIKNNLYKSSHWVTFIEPNFGLEYFTGDKSKDLIVIHYSDQYSSTEQYDTITVTNKSNQYKYIIKEFLAKKNIDIDENALNSVIKSFNSINGEWLLNMISNKGEYDREKLSIISAIKYGMSILNHEDIIWIPISLEEILRISNAVKLSKSEGVFTIKNLKQKGIHSDDLIFIGVNIKNRENLKIYYYPVEVKIGYNFGSVIDKGMVQVKKTCELIENQLIDKGEALFKKKFFRNFFVKLLISNAQKLVTNEIWKEKEINKLEEIKKYLVNDKYTVSFELEKYIGKGALISFQKDNHWRSVKKDDEILFIELTEDDAYQGIKKNINDLYSEIKQGNSDISIENLLFSKDIENNKFNEVESVVKEIFTKYKSKNNIDVSEKKDSKDIRILLGEAEGSTKDIYWEYGDKELPNRHMLITGKSGNGKTYFIQCALKELIEANVPAIIIDYTNGFKRSQLEEEFKEVLEGKIEQFMVAAEKFPLNIFKKGMRQLDEDFYKEEDDSDVANRFKSVIGAVYKDLGIQQLNSIYQTVMLGLEKYNGELNLNAFRNELEENNSSYAQTALSQLNVLLDKNPFDESKDFDWSDLHKGEAKLFIIQLTGYTKDIQKIITEMILWNLYMYKEQNGSKDKPFAVVLDEAQNLNFGENSPSTKILTEGRKFGWSAWFATQFLKGQMDKASISRLQNSAQKIYFAQTEEEATWIGNAFGETQEEKKIWTRKLINLEKGMCISHGPIKDINGKLVGSKPIKIKIRSLTDRVNTFK